MIVEHITYTIYLIAFSLGLIALIYTKQFFKKTSYKPSILYFKFLVVINVLALTGLIMLYATINLQYYFSDNGWILVHMLYFILGFLLTSFAIYTLIKFLFRFLYEYILILFKIIFFSFIFISLAFYGYGVFKYIYDEQLSLFINSHMNMNRLMILLGAMACLYTFFQTNKIKEYSEEKFLIKTAVFFLIFNSLTLIGLFSNRSSALIIIALTFLLPNSYPLLFFRKIPLVGAEKGFNILKPYAINMFFEKYNISVREQEIIQLILEGKSNKEIEGQLFISISTVKNHIYNIYQKVGVNSRSQLFNVIQKTSNK